MAREMVCIHKIRNWIY